jgi:hypothetical protein
MKMSTRTKERAIVLLGALLVVALAASSCAPAPVASTMPKVGDEAPSFLASTMVDGKEVSFPAAYRGRPVMLAFFTLG